MDYSLTTPEAAKPRDVQATKARTCMKPDRKDRKYDTKSLFLFVYSRLFSSNIFFSALRHTG